MLKRCGLFVELPGYPLCFYILQNEVLLKKWSKIVPPAVSGGRVGFGMGFFQDSRPRIPIPNFVFWAILKNPKNPGDRDRDL